MFYTQGDELQRHKGLMTKWSVNADTEHIWLYLHRTRGKKKKRYSQVKRITQVFQGMIFGTQNT